MKTLLALLLTTSPAWAIACNSIPHAQVIANLAKDYSESIHFAGMFGVEHTLPMELYISKTGTWTMIVLTPDGVCMIATGTDWQETEPKPKGTEN